ncbi:hypothetical protein ES705_24083 [subsurface metagenome]
MATFKNIRIKMKGGKTRLQRVKVFKSGKYRFVKNLGSKAKKSTPKSVKSTVTKRRKNKMAKSKRRSRKFTIPLAPVAAILAVVAKPAQKAVDGDLEGAAAELSARLIGYNPQSGQTDLMYAAENGWAPLLLGALVHKFIGGAPLNLNRMLAAANVPVIRI